MNTTALTMTYVGGPTALLEFRGLRFLTDPTFDPAGEEYRPGAYTLRKTAGPAVTPDALQPVHAVLLSHDHHFDNLDHAGRKVLQTAGRVLTTVAGAERLSHEAVGLAPWQQFDLRAADGGVVRVTGTPARHGPPNGDRGPATGFVLSSADEPGNGVYVSGDTVWFEGVREISARFRIWLAVLFMGAARVKEVGPAHLTFTAEEAVAAARAFAEAPIVPLHFEGWEHYSESRQDIAQAFARAGLEMRLRWPTAGQPMVITAT